MNAKIKAVLENKERGREWLVAALVHGSIGYYTPLGAENCVGEYIRGQRENYSERCASCFNCGLESEILHDVKAFEALPSDKQSKIIEKVREAKKLDSVSQVTFGLYYPSDIR